MKQWRAAVIGGGFIGRAHVEALRRLGDVEVAALCDTAQARQTADALAVPRAFEDYRALIDTVRPDAVHICTPNRTHYPIARYALEHGVHVVCEKPFTTDPGEARALCALAESAGLQNMVNFHNRFYPCLHELRERVRRGELGELITIHGEYLQDWLLYDTDFSWRVQSAAGGPARAVGDIGSHWLDLAEYLSGQRIAAVSALFKTQYPARYLTGADGAARREAVDTEDCALLLARFTDGAIGSAALSQMFAGKKNQLVIQLAGTRQSAVWDSGEGNRLFLGRRDRANLLLEKDPALVSEPTRAVISYPGGHAEGFPDAFKQAFRQFYDRLGGASRQDYADFHDGLHAVRLTQAICESAESGGWTEL